jgi:hypothetical protein
VQAGNGFERFAQGPGAHVGDILGTDYGCCRGRFSDQLPGARGDADEILVAIGQGQVFLFHCRLGDGGADPACGQYARQYAKWKHCEYRLHFLVSGNVEETPTAGNPISMDYDLFLKAIAQKCEGCLSAIVLCGHMRSPGAALTIS